MCAGYELDTDIHAIERAFRVEVEQLDLPLGLSQVFPKGRAPIVIEAERGAEMVRRVGFAQFGFVPSFAKDPSVGARMYNARAETVAEKPSYRRAFAKRRCLVPFTAFYEWSHTGPRAERRIFRAAQGGLFAAAGVWEVFRGSGADKLVSFAMLTTAPNGVVAPVHDRMPLLLAPEHYDAWLAPSTPVAALHTLLAPPDDALLALDPSLQPRLIP